MTITTLPFTISIEGSACEAITGSFDLVLYQMAADGADPLVKAFAKEFFEGKPFIPPMTAYDSLDRDAQCLIGFRETLRYLATKDSSLEFLLQSRPHPEKGALWLNGSDLTAFREGPRDPWLNNEENRIWVREAMQSLMPAAPLVSTHLSSFVLNVADRIDGWAHASRFLYREYCKTAPLSESIRLMREEVYFVAVKATRDHDWPSFQKALEAPITFRDPPALSFKTEILHRYWEYCGSPLGDPLWSEHHWNDNFPMMQKALQDTIHSMKI
ncbi:MAG: hypothetical protein KBC64_04715 [Simkaniaceae bacterium]|nr:hypothetical protein [Simkaniaceae bacterium]